MATHALRTEINHLTSAISYHRKILDELLARLKILQPRLDSVVYPILTLPPEITTEIFVHCLPPEEEVYGIRLQLAPLLLTRVCAAWRRVALATPALWSRFSIKIDAHSADNLTTVTTCWLGRSGTLPLFITLDGEPSSALELATFLSAFRRYAHRVEGLRLYLNAQLINQMDAHPSCSEFPCLRKLDLRLDADYSPNSLHAATMFAQAPLLFSVRLFLAEPSAVTLPWPQLTNFAGEPYYAHECLGALRLMPNLTFCRLHLVGESGNDSLHPLTHQNLRHVELVESDDFLQHLTLPALHTFHWAPFDIYKTTRMHWGSFLQRSAAPLRQLTIQPRALGSTTNFELPGVFARLPLANLELWRPDLSFATSLLQLLGSDMNFLSQLSTLRLMNCVDYEEQGSLSEMVGMAGSSLRERFVASSAQCARLVEFRVHAAPGTSLQELASLSEGSLPLLRELKDNGVVIHIGSLEQSIV